MASTVLVVDDEQDLVGAIAYNLEKEGHRALAAYDGASALAIAERTPPELIILDLMLPDVSGVEVCRRIRANPATKHIPVFMLTARGEEIDRVVGFEVGADDYLVKPFSMRELMLRVRAIARRGRDLGSTDGPKTTFGIIEIDSAAHRAWVAGLEVKLTALEFRLLETLVARRGRVQTRETLLLDVWGMSAHALTRTVDTHVKRLREKLGEAGAYVETIRGVGYRFIASVDQQ